MNTSLDLNQLETSSLASSISAKSSQSSLIQSKGTRQTSTDEGSKKSLEAHKIERSKAEEAQLAASAFAAFNEAEEQRKNTENKALEISNKLHDTILSELRSSKIDIFEREMPDYIDPLVKTSYLNVKQDRDIKQANGGPTILREKFYSSYWSEWNRDKNLLYQLSKKEIEKSTPNVQVVDLLGSKRKKKVKKNNQNSLLNSPTISALSPSSPTPYSEYSPSHSNTLTPLISTQNLPSSPIPTSPPSQSPLPVSPSLTISPIQSEVSPSHSIYNSPSPLSPSQLYSIPNSFSYPYNNFSANSSVTSATSYSSTSTSSSNVLENNNNNNKNNKKKEKKSNQALLKELNTFFYYLKIKQSKKKIHPFFDSQHLQGDIDGIFNPDTKGKILYSNMIHGNLGSKNDLKYSKRSNNVNYLYDLAYNSEKKKIKKK